jgi:AcrR family transcriptional regulator
MGASATRARVLGAAAGLIEERGFAAVSIGDLTAASGVSNGSIYHHFGSKEGVLAALVLDALADYQTGLLARLTEHEHDAAVAIRALVAFHLTWMEEHPREARLVADHRDAVAAGPAGEQLRAGTRVFLKAIRAWWRAQHARGALPDISVDLAHALVFAPAHDLARLWLAGRIRTRPASQAAVLGDAVWGALQAIKEPA